MANRRKGIVECHFRVGEALVDPDIQPISIEMNEELALGLLHGDADAWVTLIAALYVAGASPE